MAWSALCVLSSKLEGGANVVSEAIVAGVPLLASRIAGSVGLLGESYPGYFNVGDTETLAQLLRRAETDRAFLTELRAHCARLAPLFRPSRERAAWLRLLKEVQA
jgi:glycosyltransferase involved in cell wall biosynthesis